MIVRYLPPNGTTGNWLDSETVSDKQMTPYIEVCNPKVWNYVIMGGFDLEF